MKILGKWTRKIEWKQCEYNKFLTHVGHVTDDLMFLLVENLLWKDLAGSVSPSLSDESSPPAAGTGLVDTAASFAAIKSLHFLSTHKHTHTQAHTL